MENTNYLKIIFLISAIITLVFLLYILPIYKEKEIEFRYINNTKCDKSDDDNFQQKLKDSFCFNYLNKLKNGEPIKFTQKGGGFLYSDGNNLYSQEELALCEVKD
jgi:hypothetical protein